MPAERTCVLTIAGFDPTGTVGMPVDLRTFTNAGLHGLGVVSVVTAQDTVGIAGVTALSETVVSDQLSTLLCDVEPVATKTGMLWSPPLAGVVASAVDQLGQLVIDPVLVDGAGGRIIDAGIDEVYRSRLFPAATVITPNRAEAGLLVGRTVSSIDDAIEAAGRLLEFGPQWVVVTAGGPGDGQADVIATEHDVHVVETVRHDVPSVRGSGDTLSAAITAGLALGLSAFDAISNGITFTSRAIHRGVDSKLGSGRPSAMQSPSDWLTQ